MQHSSNLLRILYKLIQSFSRITNYSEILHKSQNTSREVREQEDVSLQSVQNPWRYRQMRIAHCKISMCSYNAHENQTEMLCILTLEIWKWRNYLLSLWTKTYLGKSATTVPRYAAAVYCSIITYQLSNILFDTLHQQEFQKPIYLCLSYKSYA